jgi:hypothetical protein
MPPTRRRLVPRHRRADDGEDETSIAGDVDEDSLSEGSAASLADDDADGEASDGSLDDDERHDPEPAASPIANTKHPSVKDKANRDAKEPEQAVTAFPATADNRATLNGIQAAASAEELHFDEASSEAAQPEVDTPEPQLNAPKGPRHETLAQRSRREHQEYIKERDANPAFVPNRGGFFLHDDRNSTAPSFNGRPSFRGRGRALDQGGHGA